MVKLHEFMVRILPKCKKSKKKRENLAKFVLHSLFLWLIVNVGIIMFSALVQFDY